MINVVTVKVGSLYGPEYVNKILAMVKRNLSIKFKFYCITDDPSGLDKSIKVIKSKGDLVGYWNKLLLFSDIAPKGKTLYLDLDQVLLGNITHFTHGDEVFKCYADHMSWRGCKLGSALMVYDPEHPAIANIWEEFCNTPRYASPDIAGDQGFIAQVLPESMVTYIDEKYPGQIQSYKFDVCANGINENCKLVNFHGKPKPHEIMRTEPVVMEFWV